MSKPRARGRARAYGACTGGRRIGYLGAMRHRYYGKIAGPGEPLGLVPGGPWVALEKIHGAQMQIAVAGEQVRFGKRKAWLADDDPFFGWQLVRAGLSETAQAAARRLGAPLVVFYGELFGGGYPHPEVAPVPGLQPVQTGIWYAPELRWAAFDALVAAGEDDEGELLGWSELAELARETGMLVPPVVRVGPRPHVEAAPTRAPTRVPGLLGLPALADNFAEGLVVRPDARARPGTRPTYKRKIAEFDEQRFQDSEAWDPSQRPDRAALVAWAERLTNPARVASAASKWGRHDRQAIVDEVELDVLIDLTAAFPAALQAPDEADEAAIRAAVRAAAERLL
ncbi:RNA ligase family protein [Nannocystis pusilla]|uniref:RNA ligase family protein n=1 Tax=Nannocystis pusilla TaxID=889268 RepID=UPI003BF2423C